MEAWSFRPIHPSATAWRLRGQSRVQAVGCRRRIPSAVLSASSCAPTCSSIPCNRSWRPMPAPFPVVSCPFPVMPASGWRCHRGWRCIASPNIALKASTVRLGQMVVERAFGSLALYHLDQSNVLHSGDARVGRYRQSRGGTHTLPGHLGRGDPRRHPPTTPC